MKRYGFTGTVKKCNGVTVKQIIALMDFGCVRKGQIGGYIEDEKNLSQIDNSWIFENACVYGNAVVKNSAWVDGNAVVCDNAVVKDFVTVDGNAVISGNAIIKDCARVNRSVSGDITVGGNTIVMPD